MTLLTISFMAASAVSVTVSALRGDFNEKASFGRPTQENLNTLDSSPRLRGEIKSAALAILKAADSNNDNAIDRDEASFFMSAPGHPVAGSLLRAFEAIDTDKDGVVIVPELVNVILASAAGNDKTDQAGQHGREQRLYESSRAEAVKLFELAHVSLDGSLHRTELSAFVAVPGHEPFTFLLTDFEQFDEDHSGGLTQEELTTMIVETTKKLSSPETVAQLKAEPLPPAGADMVVTDTAQEKVARAAQVLVNQADTNKDGEVSRLEAAALVTQPGLDFLSKLVSNFDTFDTDSSNTLDVNEVAHGITSMT